jgi:hypothetical protein
MATACKVSSTRVDMDRQGLRAGGGMVETWVDPPRSGASPACFSTVRMGERQPTQQLQYHNLLCV